VNQPRIVRTLGALRESLRAVAPGLVPTMGALHEGHLSLIRRAAAENPITVVSAFVNPTQFTNPSDLAAYPRDLAADAEMASEAGADLIYAPDVKAVYPPGFATSVEVDGLTRRWEGEFRPGHFRGVATVVTLLLNGVRPARSYFGEKDYQQLCVVRRMAKDLLLPGEIVGCPTVRDADGLALSSRNARLTPVQRGVAAVVPAALFRMRDLAVAGMTDVRALLEAGRAMLETVPEIERDYLAVVQPETLEPITTLMPGARALVAVRLGEIRLIDNVELAPVALAGGR
jgi:pantoate--beta-alanine ligase